MPPAGLAPAPRTPRAADGRRPGWREAHAAGGRAPAPAGTAPGRAAARGGRAGAAGAGGAGGVSAAAQGAAAPVLLHVLPHAGAQRRALQRQRPPTEPAAGGRAPRGPAGSDGAAAAVAAPGGASLVLHITRCIKQCGRWEEVDALAREHGPAFNIVHASAAITHLAQLGSGRRQQAPPQPWQHDAPQQAPAGLAAVREQMARQHQRLALSLPPALQPHAAQTHSARAPPPQQQQQLLLERLLAHALPRLREAQSRQVANMLWALAALRYDWRASAAGMAATAALCERAAGLFDSAEPQHLANIAYAVARLRVPVGEAWLSQLQDAWLACTARHGGGGGGAQATANLLWALTALQQRPGDAWLEQVFAAAAPHLTLWPARSVAVLTWGCARLGLKAPAQQRQHQAALLGALGAHAPAFSAQDVAQVLWATTEMGLPLPGPLLQQLLGGAGAQMPEQGREQWQDGTDGPAEPDLAGRAAAHSAALVLASLARTCAEPRQQLPPRLLQPWLAALLAGCAGADSHSLASAAWALCRLRLAGSCPRLVRAMLQTAAQRLQPGERQQLLQQPPGAGSDGAPPPVSARAVAALLQAAAHCAASAPGTREQQRQRQWQRQQERLRVLLQSMHAEPASDGGGCGGDGAAQAVAGVEPPPAVVQRVQPGGQALLTDAASALLLAAAGVQPEPAAQLSEAGGEQQVRQALPGASLQDLAQLLWAVSSLQLRLPAAWWRACLAQLEGAVEQADRRAAAGGAPHAGLAQSLATCVWALGRAGVPVEPHLMAALQRASLRVLARGQCGGLGPQALPMLLVGFTRMCTSTACRFPARQGAAERQQQRQQRQQQQRQQQQRQQQRQRQAPGLRQHRWVKRAGLQPAWLHAWCACASGQLDALPPDGLVALLWGLGRLRYHPGSSFLARATARAQALLPQLGARHLALLLWSLARLQQAPDAAALRALLAAWEQRLASASMADTQQAQWAALQLEQLELLQQRAGCESAPPGGVVGEGGAPRQAA
ncbi:hypothetical protein HT031_004147 [Scenedesmus sp. PABB004]|nr:hypothetical protein HT031_004147 [Scenedesmus sp. PABB004]